MSSGSKDRGTHTFTKIYVLFCFLCCRSFIDVWFVVVLSIFGLLSFYQHGVICRLITVFYLCGAIQIGKVDLIRRKYQIMVVNMLKNQNYRYSSQYFIKFVGFMLIYYAINLNIVSSCMVFSYLYLGSIDLL